MQWLNMLPARPRSFDDWIWGLFLFGTLAIPASLSVGRCLMAVVLVLLLVQSAYLRRRWVMGRPGWWGAACLVWLVVVSLGWGMNRSRSMGYLDKLLWFAVVPVAATIIRSPDRLVKTVWAFIAGCGVMMIRTFVRTPLEMLHSIEIRQSGNVRDALLNAGSMTHAQMLMLGVLATLCVLSMGADVARLSRRGWLWILLILMSVALLITMKRGAWGCALAMTSVVLVANRRWRQLVVLVVLLGMTLTLPFVRHRLGAMRDEFNPDNGGRILMWTKVAPALVKAHPWGIGYRALKNATMQRIDVRVERQRTHLHSNPLQMLVDGGWLGLGFYLMWVGATMGAGRRALRQATGRVRAAVLALLLMFVALCLNGLIEYNLGDAGIVLAYGVIVGGLIAADRMLRPPLDPVMARAAGSL